MGRKCFLGTFFILHILISLGALIQMIDVMENGDEGQALLSLIFMILMWLTVVVAAMWWRPSKQMNPMNLMFWQPMFFVVFLAALIDLIAVGDGSGWERSMWNTGETLTEIQVTNMFWLTASLYNMC